MMLTIGSAVASSSRTMLRNSSVVRRSAIRTFTTTSLLRNVAATPVDAKISGIVDQIEKLTLLEAADLVSHLKTRLNITEIAMPAASAAPAAAGAGAAAADEPAEETAKPKEKSVFTLKLAGLKDPTAKAKVIREVKAANSNMYVFFLDYGGGLWDLGLDWEMGRERKRGNGRRRSEMLSQGLGMEHSHGYIGFEFRCSGIQFRPQ